MSLTFSFLSSFVALDLRTDSSSSLVLRIEFIEHGMSDIVTLRHRNVCKEGFELEGVADAGESCFHLVFLSLFPNASTVGWD